MNSTPTRAPMTRMREMLGLVALMALAGCANDLTAPPLRPIEGDAPWRLTIDHKAINLALTPGFETITLTATVRNVAGEALPGYPAATISSSARDIIDIGDGGVLRAVRTTSRTRVFATLTIGDMTLRDTAMVRVIAAAPPLPMTSFSIQPLPGDSAKVGARSNGTLPAPRALNADGDPITGLLYYHLALEPEIVSVPTGTNAWAASTATGRVMGAGRIVAQTTAFGVRMVDTLRYRVGLPVFGSVSISSYVPAGSNVPVYTMSPAEVRIGVGGAVWWTNATEQLVGISFADPSAASESSIRNGFFSCPSSSGEITSGDIAPFRYMSDGSSSGCRQRAFATPGVYEYTSAAVPGVTGRIIVEADPPEP